MLVVLLLVLKPTEVEVGVRGVVVHLLVLVTQVRVSRLTRLLGTVQKTGHVSRSCSRVVGWRAQVRLLLVSKDNHHFLALLPMLLERTNYSVVSGNPSMRLEQWP